MTGMAAGGTLAAEIIGRPAVNVAIFAFFVLVTLVIALRVAGKNQTTTDYYAGGRAFTGPQNGIPIGGDCLSAASFLGIAGAIALDGYDGFLYSIEFLVSWLVVLPGGQRGAGPGPGIRGEHRGQVQSHLAGPGPDPRYGRADHYDGWSTTLGSAWISYFQWIQGHLVAGAQQAPRPAPPQPRPGRSRRALRSIWRRWPACSRTRTTRTPDTARSWSR